MMRPMIREIGAAGTGLILALALLAVADSLPVSPLSNVNGTSFAAGPILAPQNAAVGSKLSNLPFPGGVSTFLGATLFLMAAIVGLLALLISRKLISARK